MKKLPELLYRFPRDPDFTDEEYLKWWDDFGFLDVNDGARLKQDVANALTMVAKIIIKDTDEDGDLKENVNAIIFAMTVRVFRKPEVYVKMDGEYHLSKRYYTIHENFRFDEEKAKNFVKFASDCYDYSAISKHLNKVDLEAEYCAFLTNLYIAEQNELNRQ